MEIDVEYKFDNYEYTYTFDIFVSDMENYFGCEIPSEMAQYIDLQRCYDENEFFRDYIKATYEADAKEAFEEEKDDDFDYVVDDVMTEMESKYLDKGENPTDDELKASINDKVKYVKYINADEVFDEVKARLEVI